MYGNALMPRAREARDPRVAFWSDPSSWPIGTKDFMFAAEAILQLGRQRYGEAWSDQAPQTELITELADHLSVYTPPDEILRADRVLETLSGEHRNFHGLLGGSWEFPTQEEWQAAKHAISELAKASWTNFRPFIFVAHQLVEAARNGAVRTATRSLRGGALEEQPWHFWNGEECLFRFYTCRVPAGDPFGQARGQPDERWLFIERSSFIAYLTGNAPKTADDVPAIASIENEKRRRKTGRPRNPIWDEIINQFFRIAHYEGVPDASSSRGIAVRLAEWAAERCEDPPDVETIRKRVQIWRRGLGSD